MNAAWSFDWTDCTDDSYVYGSIATGGGGYWPCMVNITADDLEGNITADDARRLAYVLLEAADKCDEATEAERAAA